ncbi:C3 and PZP-like alpha-2-macroglobulin domain-containing protein 8 [Anneissia japonica]|uniref:C3 and PZP-like alpha-2-macroglobulin domain-containing protein 8 n=1 Tax=Anneissia japonica TaxID=1529436 RepID=UPI0014257580|nr:C3 and PZP-like alpha-2-macroglobulin domain-containing protein 8 [Anneissia japonica]
MAILSFSVFVLVLSGCFCTCANANRGYFVTCPSTLRSTALESISVTIFHPSEPVLVNVSLIHDGKEVSSSQKEILGKGTIEFKVPKLPRGEAVLKVCGNCIPGNPKGYTFFNTSLVRIEEKGSSVFLQTDRPIYKPGQTVLIRAFLVDPNLKPKDVEIFAYVVDPQGSRMIQWDNVKPMCCGVVNFTFPISDQPVLGEWFIYAKVQGQTYNISFDVQEYVLPRFHIEVYPPKYIVGFDDCHSVVISASYVYGQPVHGKLLVTSNIHGVGYFEDRRGYPKEDTVNIHGTATVRVCPAKHIDGLYGDYFRGVLHIEAKVVASDGNTFSVIDESCPVYKQQLVHIKFSEDTKQHFKPGLPFKGKILVTYPDGSPADGVTVRVKTTATQELNTYNKEFVSRDGAISFEIPVVEISTQMLWLDAVVTAIDGKQVDEFTYYSQYLTVYSWYSPTKSHLLLSNLNDGEAEVGGMAQIGLASTMPCNFTLNYDIISRGRIVTSNSQLFYQPSLMDEFSSEDGTNSTMLSLGCQAAFEIEVIHAMTPSFQLVGYVVKDDREGVADTVTIPVKPSLQNKVTVTSSVNETYPSKKVDITITSTPGSCVCIASVDRSVHLLKPNYQLTIDKVLQEMGSYSTHDEHAYEEFWYNGGKRKRRSIWYDVGGMDAGFAFSVLQEMGSYSTHDEHAYEEFWYNGGKRKRRSIWYDVGGMDAGFAFSEAGLKVMTDVVLLKFHQNAPINGGVEVTSLNKEKVESRLPKRETRKRTYFPETWLWQCFNMSSTRKQETFSVHVPDTITTWVTDVVSVSKHTGLGIASQSTIKTYKPFFVEFALPYAVIRGEQVKIPITIYNYLDTCVQASLTLGLSDGIHFVNHPGKRHENFIYCMEPNQMKTVNHPLIFDQLGTGKIHARVVALRSMECCGDSVATNKALAMDKVSKQVTVEPEGILRFYTHSVFFCPNERITISTPNNYDYKFVKKPSALRVFVFACKAKNDAHIALASDATGMDLFEIVLGGWQNTKSWIAASKQGDHLVTAATPGIMSWDEFKAFWVTFDNGLIMVGYGEVPSNSSVIMRWQSQNDVYVDYIGFSTGWGSLGEFRIWRKEDAENSFLEVFNLGLPLNYIPGSEHAVATMVGDVMGPTLTNLHNLIRLPFGCGEQNMIHFAPNVYVMSYLQRTHQLTDDREKEAIKFLVQGYQRQLTYKHNDGSYSAFGQRDSSGSMWLSAFVLKSFAQSRPFIYIDSTLLDSNKRWIINQQLPDGSFPPVGRVLNKDIQGGVKGKVSLTAYVVIALLEAGIKSVDEIAAIDNANKFLEENIQHVDDPYTAALTAYALVRLDSQASNRAVRILRSMAITQGGYTSWRVTGDPIETVARFGGFEDIKQTINSAEVEMTAYGLLTYTALGDIASALPIVKWLSQQRNALGGFTSTQDTCIALQALAEYATLAYVGGVNLTISLATGNYNLEKSFELNNQNNKVLQHVTIPQIPNMMFVEAEGEGCGLLQIDVKYNIPDPTTKQSFKLNIKMRDSKKMRNSLRRRRSADGQDELQHNSVEQDIVMIQACTRWLHPGSSNMAVLEVSLHTGLTADFESLDKIPQIPNMMFVEAEGEGCGLLQLWPISPEESCGDIDLDRKEISASSPGDLVPDDDCNTLSNDCNEDEHVNVCGCDRTCISTGTSVCGSDNILYSSVCQMEVAACKSSTSVYAVPLASCPEPVEVPKPEEPVIQQASWTSQPTEIHLNLQSDDYESSGGVMTIDQPELVDYSSKGSEMYELVPGLQNNNENAEDVATSDEENVPVEEKVDTTLEPLPSPEKIWSTVLVELETEIADVTIQPTELSSTNQPDTSKILDYTHQPEPTHELDSTHQPETKNLSSTNGPEPARNLDSTQQQHPGHKSNLTRQLEPADKPYSTHQPEPQEPAHKLDFTHQPTIIIEQTEIVEIEEEETKVLELLESSTQSHMIPDDMQSFVIDMQSVSMVLQSAPTDVQSDPADVQSPPMEVQLPPVDVQSPPVDVQSPLIHIQSTPDYVRPKKIAEVFKETVSKATPSTLKNTDTVNSQSQIQYQIWNVSNSSSTEHRDLVFETLIINYKDMPASDDPSRSGDATPLKSKENSTKQTQSDIKSRHHHRHRHQKEKNSESKHHQNVSPQSKLAVAEKTTTPKSGKSNHASRSAK